MQVVGHLDGQDHRFLVRAILRTGGDNRTAGGVSGAPRPTVTLEIEVEPGPGHDLLETLPRLLQITLHLLGHGLV